jgi:hypothetical protein
MSTNTPFNIQNILNTTLNELFNSSNVNNINFPLYDICYNTFFMDLSMNMNGNSIREEEQVDTDSLPDLIPLVNDSENEHNNNNRNNDHEIGGGEGGQSSSSSSGLQIWANLVEDYNIQIQTYQQNIQSIIQITEQLLPEIQRRRPYSRNVNRTNPNINRRNLISQLRNMFRNNDYNSQYVLEFENITPLLFPNTNTNTNTNNYPTTQEIQDATEIFIYNPHHPLAYTTCPISLEEFREGEPLMRIYNCGHIFKAFELQRWFLRNTRCPSCRYDIRSRDISLNYPL